MDTGTPSNHAHISAGRSKLALKGVAWSFLNILVSNGLTIAVFLVTSLLLQPADFGAVALATSIVIWAMTLVPIPIGDAILHRRDLSDRHLNSAFWLTLAIGLAVMGMLYLCAPVLAGWTGVSLVTTLIPLLSLRILFVSLSTVPAALINRRMAFRHITLRTALANGLGAAVCLIMVLQGFALWALVFGQIMTNLVACVVSFWSSKWRPGFEFSFDAIRDLKDVTLFSMGGRMIDPTRINEILIGSLMGPAVLGLYFFARRLCEFVQELITGTLLPVSRTLFASLQTDERRQSDALILSTLAAATAAFPLFIGFTILAPTAIPFVFGSKWLGAVYAAQCLALIGLLMSIGLIQGSFLRFSGHARWWFWFECTLSTLGFAAISVFAGNGLNSVVTALLLIAAVLWPIAAIKSARALQISIPTIVMRCIAPPLVSVAGMAIALFCLREFGPALYGLSYLAAQVCLAVPVYCGLLLWLAADDLRLVLQQLKRAKSQGTRS
ncbi:lipopolysaccharide biosynthesis protein [Phaeobacter sp.]|uniref:lipopolysaccharide biosynthesis protein n=1 Tax=Phaeobacter sp. TaxID=1902409 RepID=UPI0025D06B05|nr:lipopolysaccharide biosynthesis protein [Phaeobacter sp.]